MTPDATGEMAQTLLMTPEEHEGLGRAGDGGCTKTVRTKNLAAHRLARRRFVVIALSVMFCALAGVACWKYVPPVLAWLSDVDAVRGFVADHALVSRLTMVGVNVAQVVFAFLPGEPVELAMGYAFGFWEGTLLCLIGSAIARTAVYWAVRRWGWKIVGLFFNRAHLDKFTWLQDTRRVEVAMFIVFLIPGTPKDFLTYFAGLTSMRLPSVLLISTVGTLPSIVTSTMVAAAIGERCYLLAFACLVLAGVLVVAGAVAFKVYRKRCRRKK